VASEARCGWAGGAVGVVWRLSRPLRESAGSSRSAEETLWRESPRAHGVASAGDGAASPPGMCSFPRIPVREQWSPSPAQRSLCRPGPRWNPGAGERGAEKHPFFKSKRNSLKY